MKPEIAEVIADHEAAGRRFSAAGVESFVIEIGDGDPVVLMHGVPVSSFLYRRVAPALAARGCQGGRLRPSRPRAGAAAGGIRLQMERLSPRWTGAAIDALGIERCHLVVHDIGGPVGLEWAIRNPDRVLSLTALDTLVDVASFHRPWPMHPFSIRGVGELWLRGLQRIPFREVYSWSASRIARRYPRPRSTPTRRC